MCCKAITTKLIEVASITYQCPLSLRLQGLLLGHVELKFLATFIIVILPPFFGQVCVHFFDFFILRFGVVIEKCFSVFIDLILPPEHLEMLLYARFSRRKKIVQF